MLRCLMRRRYNNVKARREFALSNITIDYRLQGQFPGFDNV
jgi:hypothetical protein